MLSSSTQNRRRPIAPFPMPLPAVRARPVGRTTEPDISLQERSRRARAEDIMPQLRLQLLRRRAYGASSPQWNSGCDYETTNVHLGERTVGIVLFATETSICLDRLLHISIEPKDPFTKDSHGAGRLLSVAIRGRKAKKLRAAVSTCESSFKKWKYDLLASGQFNHLNFQRRGLQHTSPHTSC